VEILSSFSTEWYQNRTWHKFLQYFKKSEHFYPETDELTGGQNKSAHGFDGPIAVSYGFNVSSFFADYAIPTLEAIGKVNEDNADGTPIGGTSQQLVSFSPTKETNSLCMSLPECLSGNI